MDGERMRLIDADEFRKRIDHYPREIRDVAKKELRYCKTAEKKGKWIVHKSPDEYHCSMVKCPFCGEELIAEPNEYCFCPNCGARMDGGEE